jgi:hypothetical protein
MSLATLLEASLSSTFDVLDKRVVQISEWLR